MFKEPKEYVLDEMLFPYGDWRDQCRENITSRHLDYTIESSESWKVTRDSSMNISHHVPEFSKNNSESPNVMVENTTKVVERTYQMQDYSEEYANSMSIDIHPSIREVEERKTYVAKNKVFEVIKVKKNKNSIALRRDVVNKCIIRYFNKYVKKLFNSCIKAIKINSDTQIERKVKDEVLHKCLKLGMIKPEFFEKNSEVVESLINFISWIVTHQLKVFITLENRRNRNKSEITLNRNSISSKDEPIVLIQEIVKNYSHFKVQEFFKNPTIKIIFRHFLLHERIRFLESVSSKGIKHEKYSEALNDFELNFLIFEMNT